MSLENISGRAKKLPKKRPKLDGVRSQLHKQNLEERRDDGGQCGGCSCWGSHDCLFDGEKLSFQDMRQRNKSNACPSRSPMPEPLSPPSAECTVSRASRGPQPGQEGQGMPKALQGWGLAILPPSSLPSLCSSPQVPVFQKPQVGG